MSVSVRIERNGNHMRGGNDREFRAAAEYLRQFMETAEITGDYELYPLRATRWMGDPEPRVRVKNSDARHVLLACKPNGNDSVYEYSLVPSGGKAGFLVAQELIRAIDKRKRSGGAEPPRRVAAPPPLPARPEPETARPEPAPAKVVKPSSPLLLEKVTVLQRTAARLSDRQARIEEIDGELRSMEERLDALTTERDKLAVENEGDKDAKRATEMLAMLGELIG